MRNRIVLLLLACFACLSFAQAQTFTVTISGTVTEVGTGNPVANHDVYITFDSTSGFSYSAIVQTNALGQYTDVVTGVGGFLGQGDAYVWTEDCNFNHIGSPTLSWSSVNNNFTNVNFQVCTTPMGGGCQASFSSNPILGTTGYNFADMSTTSGPAVSVVSWAWDFGDGNTSSQQNPIHYYNANTAHTVCLTIWTSDSCTSVYCDSVGFGGGGNCMAYYNVTGSGCTFAFSDSSFSNNQIATYTWDFGDGTTGFGTNATHTYAANGTYVVCLSIADGNGCTDTYCSTVTANCGVLGCNAGYFWYPDSSGQYSIIIVNTSVGSNPGSPLNYLWTFGDGSSSTAANPSHVYSGPGNYVVCVTITEPNSSCTSTFCDSLLVLNRMSVPFSINVISGTVGMQPQPSANVSMQLAPNPANDRVVVSFEAASGAEARVELLDLQGRVLRTNALGMAKSGANSSTIEVGDMPRGMYLIQVVVGEERQVKKLMLAE